MVIERGRTRRATRRARPGGHRRGCPGRGRLRRPVHGHLDGVVIRRAEVEHSIFLRGSRLEDLDARVESSLVGRDVTIARSTAKPRAYRFMVGDSSEIGIL